MNTGYCRGLIKKITKGYKKSSYSQCGEDLIIEFIFETLKIAKPLYLDIGAHHPIILNNTYLFYKKGSQGVCIEPDPTLYLDLRKKRRRDLCLNIGVGVLQSTKADFYIMTCKTLNTFVKDEAERYQSYGKQKIEKVVQIPLVHINDVLQNNFQRCPNLISIDVEGMELVILKSFDFSKYRPEVFCIETLVYTEDKSEKKIDEIIDLMISSEYMVYADTYINTIFVDKKTWLNR